MNEIKQSNNHIIRKANVCDAKKIEQLMQQSMQVLGKGHYSDEQISSACKYICVPDLQIIEDGTYYVVENADEIMIGCGGWSCRNTLYAGPKDDTKKNEILNPKKDMARIRAMFVLPSASGKGIGSLLLDYCERAAKEYGFSKAALGATQSGLNFYKSKHWMVIKEETAVLPDGKKIEITHMEKNLYLPRLD